MSALLRQTSRRVRALLPILSSVTLVLIGLMPIGLPHFDNVAPAFALMAVFYWSIFRSDLMTMIGAFMIGLLLDLLSAGPLGLNVLALVLVHELGMAQRKVFLGSSFMVNWAAFALVVGAVLPAGWAVVSLLHWRLLPTAPLLAQLLLSLTLYPAVYWVLSRLERRWLRASVTA
ncbi:rod shape-determining protein MreD [Ferrovibrio terrae]|jgi:rod shape-determining protein MreD|uniref:Rod shape-determining protein MreD n=1 Tax=Ferrovibrio terrae TaxID=2594003 RepID=A0A516GWN4_9PROT|nr:rod shape-determining protein MreD [Ferrovibrio terrae]QDO95937.1 rod shape-determining protein MreD [Ferrovibrio terrae]